MRSDSYYDSKARILHDNKVLARKHTESRTEFVRNVFHEIRTPMHVLSNFFCDTNPSREDFEDMKHHTGNVLYVLCNIIEYSAACLHFNEFNYIYITLFQT